MKKIILLLIAISFFTACKNKQEQTIKTVVKKTILEKIATAHGISHWNDIKELKFTFNVDRGASHFERSWHWNRTTKTVIQYSKTDTTSYNRASIDSTIAKTDASFINDKYWLLAPFNLVWDKNITYSVIDSISAPISNETMQKLTIVYPKEGGYTPGDAYDFYFRDDYIIREWSFRKANAEKASLTTTWEDYIDISGIKIAQIHKNKEGDFKLFFTDLAITK